MLEQPELPLFNASGADGYEAWLAERLRVRAEMRQSLHLPLGDEVEVWLKGGVRLRGRLLLREGQSGQELQNASLSIGKVAFTTSEMESCVRID